MNQHRPRRGPRISAETVHASTVANDGRAVLITGPSGSGKSDLALRLLDRGFTLVSDDQTIVKRDGDRLMASAPPTIAGKLEIRGIGIVDMEHADNVPVALIVELTSDIQRLPTTAGSGRSSASSAADHDRRHDGIGAVEGRARARSHGPEVLMAGSAAPAAPAARHRHVRGGQIDRARCARGHGLGGGRQPPRRPAPGVRPRRRSSADRSTWRSGWTCAAAASILQTLPELIRSIEGVEPEMLYLDCAGGELIRRYDETRRRHPLAPDRPAEDGIARERAITFPLRTAADSIIDTTDLSPAELRDELRRRYGGDVDQPVLTIISFAFSRGISRTADLVFDMRFLPNPHWVEELRPLTGEDPPVRAYLERNRPGARRWTESRRFSSTGFPATGPPAKVT